MVPLQTRYTDPERHNAQRYTNRQTTSARSANSLQARYPFLRTVSFFLYTSSLHSVEGSSVID